MCTTGALTLITCTWMVTWNGSSHCKLFSISVKHFTITFRIESFQIELTTTWHLSAELVYIALTYSKQIKNLSYIYTYPAHIYEEKETGCGYLRCAINMCVHQQFDIHGVTACYVGKYMNRICICYTIFAY